MRLDRRQIRLTVVLAAVVLAAAGGQAWAVTSRIVRHRERADLLKGRTDGVVVGSRGTLELGPATDVLVDAFADVWSINCLWVSGDTVYVGTSPNGGVYEYRAGRLRRVYPASDSAQGQAGPDLPFAARGDATPGEQAGDANGPAEAGGDANRPGVVVEQKEYLSNEHVFAMGQDASGRLLVGISGRRCRLCRLEDEQLKVILEPGEARYIFAMAVDKAGCIYLGTGPQGQVYRLAPDGGSPEVVYDSPDKGILSLAVDDKGIVYAGSDTRGLIYRIDPQAKTATVLFDSDQPEVTALLVAGPGELYAATTSAQMVETQSRFAAQSPSSGRPDVEAAPDEGGDGGAEDMSGGRTLEIANSGQKSQDSAPARTALPAAMTPPPRGSYVYRITGRGFVKDVFREVAVFFNLTAQGQDLLVGTGNKARLYRVNPASEISSIVFEDEQASQITAVATAGREVYVGTANPARLVRLSGRLRLEGEYLSELIDAGQPADWGKLQIDADIPDGCTVLMASRMGNVGDVNDPAFSPWSRLREVDGPAPLAGPLGRFCQYKLVLRGDGSRGPVIREVAVANTVPNVAPQVEAVNVAPLKAPGKDGFFKIAWRASDGNGDTLVYRVDFRRQGRSRWIEMRKGLPADNIEWDGRTVEDGRYEIRVTADDERSNTSTTKLTASRVSDPVVVDSTAPRFRRASLEVEGSTATLTFRVVDALSMIGEVQYTVNSQSDWIGTVPEDLVFDTRQEDFRIVVTGLEPGEHVIAVRAADAAGNVRYRTFDVRK